MTAKIPIHATYSGTDSDGLSEYQLGETLQIDSGLVLANSHTISIGAETVWGWGDITAEITARGGSSAPSFSAITGLSTLYAYNFVGSATLKEVFVCWHIPHDYAENTPVYFHTHWMNATASPASGDIKWNFEYIIAKGHNQQAFPSATTTISKVHTANTTRYWHHITETDAISSSSIEVDALIYCRIYRDPTDVQDTLTDDVFLLTADVHYQKNKYATRNRSFPFNS